MPTHQRGRGNQERQAANEAHKHAHSEKPGRANHPARMHTGVTQPIGQDLHILPPQNVQQLQRMIGNRALGKLRAQSPIQREIDTSSSPSLPEYAENEVPAWQDEQGVPEWAQEEYRREAQRTLICSMTPDGKIGSVYFSGDQGRIRTTHGAGPARETHEEHTTVQFNLDEEMAVQAFLRSHPKHAKSPNFWSIFDGWLVRKLQDIPVKRVPAWATLVDNPDNAHDLSTGAPPENIKLFEIFKNINGKVESWHPSRGTATKLETNKQAISVLEAAIAHINAEGLEDPQARNIAFYNFVKSRLPDFVKHIRHPDEIG